MGLSLGEMLKKAAGKLTGSGDRQGTPASQPTPKPEEGPARLLDNTDPAARSKIAKVFGGK